MTRNARFYATPQPVIAPVQQDAEQKTFSMYGGPDLQQIILRKLKEKFDAQQPVIAPVCRSDGRCQYAIDHGAEGLGHCPAGKCCMPAQPVIAPTAYRVYFPDAQRQDYCDELDELCEDLTNCRHEITPLYATLQPVIAPALSLTHQMIDTAYRKVWSTVTHRERLAAFAYEIEATITGRKQ